VRFEIREGDCRDVLTTMADASVDAALSDPPFEQSILGSDWDRTGVAFDPEVWSEVLRVLKPGGHLLAFGATRTHHRLAIAVEDAGFSIRDQLVWLHSNGQPHGKRPPEPFDRLGTLLKPAHTPILLARRPPIKGPIIENLKRFGTGALSVDDCRVAGGRWPSTVLLDEEAAKLLDDEVGPRPSGSRRAGTYRGMGYGGAAERAYPAVAGSDGPPSRFFYTGKASRRERDAGLSEPNPHPTVKPLSLMRYLCRLIVPQREGAVVLDPFCGSGSTGAAAVMEGMNFLGIEMSAAYAEVARARIAHWAKQPAE
jgi:DNA modification methylase